MFERSLLGHNSYPLTNENGEVASNNNMPKTYNKLTAYWETRNDVTQMRLLKTHIIYCSETKDWFWFRIMIGVMDHSHIA